MTRDALASYCTDQLPCSEDNFLASPGPICLYECRGYRVGGLDLQASRTDDGTIYVQVSVEFAKTPGAAQQNSPFSNNESLTLGEGTPLGGAARRPLVINEATTSS